MQSHYGARWTLEEAPKGEEPEMTCKRGVHPTKTFPTSDYIILWLFVLVDFYRSLERRKGLTPWRCGISGLKLLLYHRCSALPCRCVCAFETSNKHTHRWIWAFAWKLQCLWMSVCVCVCVPRCPCTCARVPLKHQWQEIIPPLLIQNKAEPEMTSMIYHTQPPASQKEGHLNATSAPVHPPHPPTVKTQKNTGTQHSQNTSNTRHKYINIH